MDEPFLVLLTGPPGAGKTTVGRIIAEHFRRSVCIESDWFWSTIRRGFITPWKANADPQNRAVIRSFVSAGARMVLGDYTTVVEGIIGPWYLDLVREELRQVEITTHYIVLRPALASSLQRANSRGNQERVPGHPPLTDEEPIRQMWQLFADLGEYEHHVVDSTDLSEPETAECILQLLNRRGQELVLV